MIRYHENGDAEKVVPAFSWDDIVNLVAFGHTHAEGGYCGDLVPSSLELANDERRFYDREWARWLQDQTMEHPLFFIEGLEGSVAYTATESYRIPPPY